MHLGSHFFGVDAVCLALAPVSAATAQPAAVGGQAQDLRFTPEQTSRDLDILRRALLDMHPGLTKYGTAAQFDSAVADARQQLARGATRAEVFLAMTRLAAAIRCGHTWTNPLNQAQAVQDELFGRADKLPLRLSLIDDRFLVTASAVDGISGGDELLAVDGHPVADIVGELLFYARADGSSDGKRRAQMSHLFELSAMDMYWPLLHPPKNGRYTLSVRTRGAAAPTDRTIDAVTPAARDSLLRSRGVRLPDETWTMSITGDTAVMRIPTFSVEGADSVWQHWFRDAFAQLNARKVPVLILDIRDAEGGNTGDTADSLLSHLLRRPFVQQAVRPESAYERVPYNLARFLDTWNFGFFDRTGKVTKGPGRNWYLPALATTGDTIPAAAAPYQGRTFLLVGPVNSSASFFFARRVQESGVATLVGQRTGGNMRGLNGGELAWIVLPNSGVSVDIPLISSTPAAAQPDASVVPDVVVGDRFAAMQRGLDPDREAVRRLVRTTGRAGRRNP